MCDQETFERAVNALERIADSLEEIAVANEKMSNCVSEGRDPHIHVRGAVDTYTRS